MARRLFIGGPWDGKWHDVDTHVFQVLRPVKLDVMQYLAPKPGDMEIPLPDRVEYYRDEVDLFGYRLEVMVAYHELDDGRSGRTEAMLRAILQRDVAAALNLKR